MARIAILEPSDDVRELLALLVARLGHKPVLPEGDVPADVDVLLVEPASAEELRRAREAVARRSGLPVICASIEPKSQHAADGLVPSSYLVKPFGLAELDRAVRLALTQPT